MAKAGLIPGRPLRSKSGEIWHSGASEARGEEILRTAPSVYPSADQHMRPFRPMLYAGLLFLLPGCFMPAATANRLENRWQDAREAEVDGQLRTMIELADERGWRLVGEHSGFISEWNSNDEPRFTLPSSGAYTMVGVCDLNCNDIDLVVLTSDRYRIGEDLEPDDAPVVEFTGERGSSVLGRVTIPGCGVERCAYGVILLGR